MQLGPEQFRDWMRRRGFTQADASRYLDFTEPYLSDLLNGRGSPGLANAVHLERFTGIPVEAWTSELSEAADEEVIGTGKRKVRK